MQEITQEQYIKAIRQGVTTGFLDAIELAPASRGAIFEAISAGIHSALWGWLDEHKQEIIKAIAKTGKNA